MKKAKDDGRVKALMSWNFNNLECSRPLPPDATDEDYRREFDKAIELTHEAVRRLQKVNEVQRRFDNLCGEYLYLSKMVEFINKRVADGEASNMSAMALRIRLAQLEQVCFREYVSPHTWEENLYDAVGDQMDDEEESPF